jgi:plasmid stabilization system protein ParE
VTPYTTIFDGRARDDVSRAKRWYRKQSVHLAKRFNDELQRAIEELQDAPLRWREWRPQTRRYILHRFPYNLFYEVSGRQIIILALLHQQRDVTTRFPEDP